jgi:hypothetical protein
MRGELHLAQVFSVGGLVDLKCLEIKPDDS